MLESRVPRHFGEDDLLPRIWGPVGSEAGTPAPGGWIARTDPDGVTWELLAVGLRNPFDVAFNRAGELFAADADAEFVAETLIGDTGEAAVDRVKRGCGMIVNFPRGKGEVFHAGSCEWVAALKRGDAMVERVTANVLNRYLKR